MRVIKKYEDKSVIFKLFGGKLRSQVVCSTCMQGSNTYEPFLSLSLVIFSLIYRTLALNAKQLSASVCSIFVELRNSMTKISMCVKTVGFLMLTND